MVKDTALFSPIILCNAVFLTQKENPGHDLSYRITRTDEATILPTLASVTYARGSYQHCTKPAQTCAQLHAHPAPYGASYLRAVSQREPCYKLMESGLKAS